VKYERFIDNPARLTMLIALVVSVYSIKRDFSSEAKDSKIDETRNMTSTQAAPPKKVEGVGPTTREGMPLTLRSVRQKIA
jgi:hypothetical protein